MERKQITRFSQNVKKKHHRIVYLSDHDINNCPKCGHDKGFTPKEPKTNNYQFDKKYEIKCSRCKEYLK